MGKQNTEIVVLHELKQLSPVFSGVILRYVHSDPWWIDEIVVVFYYPTKPPLVATHSTLCYASQTHIWK